MLECYVKSDGIFHTASPGPVTLPGGIHDLPAGSHGYFTVDLQPGDYAFIAEVPGPEAAGFVLPFTVADTSP